MTNQRTRTRLDSSARELDVLRAMAQGITNREIADQLYLSQRTVDSHVMAILSRLGASTRRDAKAEGRKRSHLDR